MDHKEHKGEVVEFQLGDKDGQYSALSDTSSESGEDTAQQKINSWKVLVTHLQKELLSEKVKTRGQSTIINSLKELKTENNSLQEHLRQQTTAVSVLQNRLDKLGAPTSVTLLNGELLLPGPSKQVLDSLAEENIQLKKSLKYVAVDPERMEMLQRQIRVLEVDLAESQRQFKHMESDNKRLSTLLNSSESAKDLEILKLQGRISELENNKDTQNILCQSLSDESEGLRSRLRETVRQCQQLEQQLVSCVGSKSYTTEERSRPRQSVTTDVGKVNGASVTGLSRSVSEHPEQSIGGLQMLVKKQDIEIKEVTEMNLKWQKYNDQREEYVRKLHKKVTETEDKLAKCHNELRDSASGGITEQQQADIDRIILQYKSKVEAAEEQKEQIEDENRHLKTRLAAIQADVKAKEEEITLLRGHVQVLSNGDSMNTGNLADKEKIQLLEQQITVWSEDFNQERRDREKAVEKATKLEIECDFLRRQLEQSQGRQMEALADRRQQSLMNQQRQYYGDNYSPQDMMARGVVHPRYETDGEDTVDAFEGNLKLASTSNSNQGISIPQGELRQDSKDEVKENNYGLKVDEDDTLECPKCHLTFPLSEHFELLDHINECC